MPGRRVRPVELSARCGRRYRQDDVWLRPMGIRNILVPLLVERFKDRGLRLGSASEPIAIFPAAHSEVGDVNVSEGKGGGVDVSVGDVARDHFFNPYEEERDTGEAAQGIARNVVRFLQELFADRL